MVKGLNGASNALGDYGYGFKMKFGVKNVLREMIWHNINGLQVFE